ncbi:B12-binding domain-containing radical SAM protein [Bacillus cereus]|uniref:B12-binding domain-containing radical SAM protein n=1 Tax=Bacillus cereus TaxID=1396 RepID=UPI002AC28281|nr:radical SAM protein [Bacillus cereus]MDZ4481525.1 radical SAM protein [Bacillus cereus]MDZ4497377.1 radical SAM protein [Bacillus cereus]MDZ4583427.1 radical SAM protein [Bacillus cereus]
MNILIIWPPHVPSYFNAGHHLPVFQVGAYLRKLEKIKSVTCIDAGSLNYTWKDIGDLLVQNDFDLIAVMNDFDAIDEFKRFTKYIRTLTPKSKIMTFGRLSKQIPEFFERYDIDSIAHTGDYEASVASYVEYLLGERESISGINIRENGIWKKGKIGNFLEPEEWEFPDVNEIPYEAYSKMYLRDANKFCGIPQRRELVINVARGCPVGCAYCDVHTMQGKKERRLSVDRVIDYIEKSFQQQPFEYVSMYAPTFTLNKRWVLEFCDSLIKKGAIYPWKCVTTTFHLTEELVREMAKSGCVRISVGVETLDIGAKDSLPKIKQDSEKVFNNIADWCVKYGIELNCFVILGLPGETLEGAEYTMQRVREKGGRVRPTIYTPYHLLREDMSEEDVSSFNRQLFIDGIIDGKEAYEIYQKFFAAEPFPTTIYNKIPEYRS